MPIKGAEIVYDLHLPVPSLLPASVRRVHRPDLMLAITELTATHLTTIVRIRVLNRDAIGSNDFDAQYTATQLRLVRRHRVLGLVLLLVLLVALRHRFVPPKVVRDAVHGFEGLEFEVVHLVVLEEHLFVLGENCFAINIVIIFILIIRVLSRLLLDLLSRVLHPIICYRPTRLLTSLNQRVDVLLLLRHLRVGTRR